MCKYGTYNTILVVDFAAAHSCFIRLAKTNTTKYVVFIKMTTHLERLLVSIEQTDSHLPFG